MIFVNAHLLYYGLVIHVHVAVHMSRKHMVYIELALWIGVAMMYDGQQKGTIYDAVERIPRFKAH